MGPTILNENLSSEYKERGREEVRKWGEEKKKQGRWNWFNLKNALQDNLDAIKYYPYNQHAWTNIAYVCHLIGKVDMAKKCLQRSYELARPNHLGQNYRNVEKAIKNNSYLAGGTVDRPPLEPWFLDKYEYYQKKIEYYIENWGTKKILILAANPKATSRVRFDEEIREIEDGLLRSKHRDQFELMSRLAVRYKDLRRALLENKPQIVHFIGHGDEDGLMVEDEAGNAKSIPVEVLSELFGLCSDHIESVILSACYSAPQANAISKHINYVIRMGDKIMDEAAIEFAVGFYDALIAGEPVKKAFTFGCNAIRNTYPDFPAHLIPVLKKRKII